MKIDCYDMFYVKRVNKTRDYNEHKREYRNLFSQRVPGTEPSTQWLHRYQQQLRLVWNFLLTLVKADLLVVGLKKTLLFQLVY